MVINDVLPTKAARRDASANLKSLGPQDTRDLMLVVSFTSLYGATLFRWIQLSERLRRVGKTPVLLF